MLESIIIVIEIIKLNEKNIQEVKAIIDRNDKV